MDHEKLTAELQRATGFIEEEASRLQPPLQEDTLHVLPGTSTTNRSGFMSDSDIKVLREKHLFLSGFSDNLIRMTPIGDLMKIESTALKAREMERVKDAEDRLAVNKTALASSVTLVPAGSDNRWNILHQGRFLGGACCSSAKMWLAAREYLGSSHDPPVRNYDMGLVGPAGYVSARGWAEIHNPASTKLSVRMFNINNCAIMEINEFKLALRALRTAMQFVMPWNMSMLALEGYFLQTNYCSSDLANVEKKAWFLNKFSDYVLSLNADR
jgi:hypothetical protein